MTTELSEVITRGQRLLNEFTEIGGGRFNNPAQRDKYMRYAAIVGDLVEAAETLKENIDAADDPCICPRCQEIGCECEE